MKETPAEHIGASLHAVIERAKSSLNYYPQIFDDWYKVVGPTVSSYTKPKEFKEGNLVVIVNNSVLLSELKTFLKQPILQKLKALRKDVTIKDLYFKVGDI